ncbi:carbonic anhydrase [Catellatospora sp. KI3]|uniref:carbonic anhydrase n=1 Tax=Catellatospora sp. KI3 TaxID=3041620 RepID=UPI002482537C|nr:carbonic anhydrase [Catellatospora sp. KI3]MDI1463799.1 carbonic anhydrase [Catellatospora sp. KI3]
MTLSETAPTIHQTAPDRGPSAPGPAEALADLLAGNRRFAAGRPRYGHHIGEAAARSSTQEPYAVVVGCIDSRVPLEAVFDQNFGSICVVRSGGHVLDRSVIGSVEFAVTELHAPLILVLGHERCGAVAATVEAVRSGSCPDGYLGYLVEEITPAVTTLDPDAVPGAIRRHVERTADRLRVAGRLAAPVAEGRVQVVGAVYDLDTGVVSLI